MRVLYAKLPAQDIFNACDPAWFFDVAEPLKEVWWDEKYDPLRQLLHDSFVELFDESTRHYTNLRESIARHGIQDPIIVTAGTPFRPAWMIPPWAGTYVCETIGGSRLMLAQELEIDIPCIINDRIGVEGKELRSPAEVISYFVHKDFELEWGPPVNLTFKTFSHMPDDYTMRMQVLKRRATKQEIINRANQWLRANR